MLTVTILENTRVFNLVSVRIALTPIALACGEPDLAGAVPGVRVLS
jgi:hypothetical protein